MAKSGSKLVTGIIAFLLGFIFAIIVEIGAVFGVYMFVVNSDLNTVMSVLGIPNTDDRYVNTNKEDGGVTTVKELLSGIKGLVYEDGQVVALGKSIDDFKNLIPATQMVLDLVYGIVDDYIELDHDEFQSRPMTELAQVLSDSIMSIKTGPFLEKLGMDTVIGDDANPVVKSLLAGAECDYATVKGTGLKLPVMYDYYTDDGDTFARIDYNGKARPVNGTSAYPENLRDSGNDWLCNAGTYKDVVDEVEHTYARYALYYVPCRVTASGIEEAEYIIDEYVKEDDGKIYKFQVVKYGEGTDFIAVKPINGKYEISFDAVYPALNSQSTGASDRFEGYSYYEPYAVNYYYDYENTTIEKYEIKTVSGKNYFRDSQGKMIQLDALTLTDIVLDPFAPLDSVLVTEVVGENSDMGEIFGTTTLGALLRGEGIDDIINDLEIGTFVENISPDNKVMCYIAYKISDLRDNGNGTYTAIYDKDGEDEKEVTVYAEKGYITNIYDDEDNEVPGVKVKDVAALTNAMPVTVLMDVNVEEPIMAYLGYGVTGVKAQTGDGYRYVGKVNVGGTYRNCNIATEESGGVVKITAVWYFDDEGERVFVGGTKVNEVSDRMNSFTDDLTVGDVLKLDGTESQLLKAIKDTPLSGMSNRIDALTVGEIIASDELEKSSMLRQLKNTKVSELSTAIDKLFIQRVYAEEVYGVGANSDPALATDYHADWLYYKKVNGVFVLANTQDNPPEDDAAYDNALGHISQAEFSANANEYYTYGEAQGMWRIVLYNNEVEKAYTMNNFNNMVASCADNVYKSTLYDLQKAGIIDGNKDLSGTFNGTELGTITLKQLIDIVISMST